MFEKYPIFGSHVDYPFKDSFTEGGFQVAVRVVMSNEYDGIPFAQGYLPEAEPTK
jgi:hypothetical protein